MPGTSNTGKLTSGLSDLTQQDIQRESEFNEVKKQLRQGGFAQSQISIQFQARKQDIATEIIYSATANNFDVIVLNRKPARVTRLFSGSVSHKIMMPLKDTTVCCFMRHA
jgi:hypothetical protein